MPLLSTASRRESFLLALAALFLCLAALALTLAPSARANVWLSPFDISNSSREAVIWVFFFTWLACASIASFATRRLLPTHDPYLLPVVYLLTGWGIALIWRLAPNFGLRQTAWLVVATAALIGIVWLPGDLRWLRRYRYSWLLGGLALTALTLIFGVNPSGFGERLWLGCCGFYLQPAEILKLLLVVFLAAYLADKREQLFQPPIVNRQSSDATSNFQLPARRASNLQSPFTLQPSSLSYFLPLLLMWGFSIVLLVSQRDLGMSTLFFAAFLIMLYLASSQTRYVIAGLALLLLAGVVGYALFDVVRIRVEAWWNPFADPTGHSYQIVQSLIAIASGGILGRGPGQGAPTLIPVAHSDFIFAALAEEWGLAGLLASTGLLALVVFRGLRIALQTRPAFEQLLAGGLTALIGVQALVIMGGVLKLVPLTGLTLPFMSYGGSSLLTHFIMIGLLLKLSSSSQHPTPNK